ncbi:MAG: carbamoyl-phosphate synthase large subunit [Candidatus Abyssobacteria bacterium SURF_17]|uniref:acetyl-CoA carboxylase n=1 Tax=Candidatus Abyssobacteria bacterium SURF_17 TaxID=2093361 RepID=A0A419ETT9_9BACT|nr:MAG: carbamoyl-phosphate synthase large subunit [Candidatus Abyssubacteria bacterium SURF_17]
MKLLVANRGEIAVRILRAAAEMDIGTVAVFSEDDAHSLHICRADENHPLPGKGIKAYLDIERILAAAKEHGCDAIHPAYGFLSENAHFARRCAEEGITFVGPAAETLELLGDKAQARELARRCGVPVLPGTSGPATLQEARAFFASLGKGAAIMIKAVAGGGGRGMRPAHDPSELDDAFRLCQSEARAAFGNGEVYIERFIPRARHIEVQVIGDGSGRVSHLRERECTLQRRNQKIVEIAPSPTLSDGLRKRLCDAAVRIAAEVRFRSLGTFEFLVDADAEDDAAAFFFIEANPRLQVEHTVTEELTGVDLVRAQIEVAAGRSLAELSLRQADIPPPHGYAIQVRVNMEEMNANGEIRPSEGRLISFDVPSGPGVRIDTFVYPGYLTNPSFDSLLAKLVCRSRSSRYADVVARAYRALCEFRVEGVRTNISLLQNLLRHPDVVANRVTTRFIEHNIEHLADANSAHDRLYFTTTSPAAGGTSTVSGNTLEQAPENTIAVAAIIRGTVISIDVAEGALVHQGQSVAVVEAMKMQHTVRAAVTGIVRFIVVSKGETVSEGQPLMFIEPRDADAPEAEIEKEVDLDEIRPDLAEAIERHRSGLDEARPDPVARRRKIGMRTARENIADLVDPGSFIEYGSLSVAAQRRRRSMDDLVKNTPADGLVAGIGSINGDLFDETRARCMVMAYDYTVLAGTQGMMNHKKKDRMLQIAEQQRLPVVLFAEGGGGRPGDVDVLEVSVAGLDITTFKQYAKLSGLVPLVGIVAGRCFAGNAALLGCCDVIIATKNSNIGMGGPAMIEGGGLGACKPEEIGPIDIQTRNGVVDVAVEDEAEAVRVAKKYLSYLQGPISKWECADQRLLRRCVPENRLRVYNVRAVIDTLADTGSVLELRPKFGIGIITALIRVEGRPFGLIANNPMHLGGAIDAPGADKAARFMQLCDAFDIPIVTLCDTPGFMVGPEAERTAQVRHFCRMFVVGAGVTVPWFAIVLRKGYGLGAQAMVGGSFHNPFFIVSWPTGEFGGMGLEGAVRLGFRKELEAVEDPKEREALFESMVAMAYQHGKALNMASVQEIDDVIDPVETRSWLMRGLRSVPPPEPRTGKKRPCVDAW